MGGDGEDVQELDDDSQMVDQRRSGSDFNWICFDRAKRSRVDNYAMRCEIEVDLRKEGYGTFLLLGSQLLCG